MYNCKEDMFEFMSNYISKSDVYAANVIAKVSIFIYKRRQELQMTQKEFAEMMGVTQGMVSKWESADYNFTIENIAHIAEKLNTTFDIEFIPESEYLVNNLQNEYDNIAIENSWDLPKIIEYNQFAA